MTANNDTSTQLGGTVSEGAATDPAAVLVALESQAMRVETPCGDGVMVWRIWGEGEPVVLAHGSSGSWAHWLRNIPYLAQTRKVIVPDLPGHGDSATSAAETHESISLALATGLERILGAGKPADLVGFSYGAVVLVQLAALHPQVARRLVIVGPGGLETPLGPIDLRSPRGLEGEARAAILRSNLLGFMLHNPDSVTDLALHIQSMGVRAARFRGTEQMVMPDKLVAVLPRVHAPLDAIWGEFDRPHPHPAEQEASLRRFQPNMDFRVIADAGHWAMYERPEAFNTALGEILAARLRAV